MGGLQLAAAVLARHGHCSLAAVGSRDRYGTNGKTTFLDGRRLIASSNDLATLDSLVVATGVDPEQVAFERIELDDVYLGGAELS